MSIINKVRKPTAKESKMLYRGKVTGHSPISFLLSIVAIFIMFYIGVKYINDPDSIARSYAQYAFLLACLGLSGFMLLDYLDDGKITIIPKQYATKDYIRTFIIALVLFIVNALIQYFAAITLRLALSLTDRILYYIFAAPCEELFFRTFIIDGFSKLRVKGYISVPISAVAFMLAHTMTYIANLPMYVSTLLAGFTFGGFYYYFKDLGGNQLGHLFNNLRAVPNVLATF